MPADDQVIGSDYYQLERMMPGVEEIRAASGRDWRAFLKADLELGRHDRLVRHALDSPHTAGMSEYERAILLNALVIVGRGDLLKSGRLAIKLSEDEGGLFALAAACLVQAGDAPGAVELLSNLSRHRTLSENTLRYLLLAAHASDGGAAGPTFTKTVEFAGARVDKDWLDYERLRYRSANLPGTEIGMASENTIRREKHVARLYPLGADRAFIDEEVGRELFADPREMPKNIEQTVRALADAALNCAGDPEIAEKLNYLEDIRRRYAPDAEGPIQIISTGRAGTTAVFEWIDGSGYKPFHSFGWQLAPIHRWGLGMRVAAGDVGPNAIKPFIKAYLFCRLPELVSAYRAGSVPVIVSHWDSIFAPINQALLGARIAYFRRDPENVIRSMVVKRQYACSQIATLPHHRFDDGSYHVAPEDFSRNWGEHIAWFLTFTEHYWRAIQTVFPERCLHGIESDGLFRGEADSILKLHENFPLRNGVEDETRRKFAVPVNVKSDKNVAVTEATEAILSDTLAAYRRMAT